MYGVYYRVNQSKTGSSYQHFTFKIKPNNVFKRSQGHFQEGGTDGEFSVSDKTNLCFHCFPMREIELKANHSFLESSSNKAFYMVTVQEDLPLYVSLIV